MKDDRRKLYSLRTGSENEEAFQHDFKSSARDLERSHAGRRKI